MTESKTEADAETTEKPAELLNWQTPESAPDDSLTARQLIALKKGVRAAIADDDLSLGTPGDLHGEHWNHAGVGVSVYMHRSGVVVMATEGDTLVTDADTLDHMSTARAVFFANPGPAVVTTDDLDDGEGA